ncbi:MAG: sulfatase-like hydrolase/transferase, partial [Bacteroidia bacterium]|nr:sulfatase-like hydrolase/transferase [Bacteroidia bacterium]
HQAGIGAMVEDYGHPSYRGKLGENTVTIAEVLKNHGYQTYQVGKWHVGEEEAHWPGARGFDQYFTFINGASSYYNLWPYRAGADSLKMVYNGNRYRPNQGYYMTDAFSEHAARFIEQHNSDQPFFMYLAYTAPHWPLHALPEDIAKYRGKYQLGWDSLRAQRFEKMQKLGVIPSGFPLSPRHATVPAWANVPEAERDQWDTKMALYAAVIDRMDQGIGRVLEALEKKGELENTFIVFLSDNGGCHETMPPRNSPYPIDGPPGAERSFPSYDPPWANVSNTPFTWFKSFTHQGGIASPFIVYAPSLLDKSRRGSVNSVRIGHISDLMPTALELAGVPYPEEYQGRKITPTVGQSIIKSLHSSQETGHEILCWEHLGSRAIRQGDWKLVANGKADWVNDEPVWELYNLAQDPFETQNVISEFPERAEALKAQYAAWAVKTGVLGPKAFNEIRR